MNEPSIFTKIINGEIPSYKIYENNYTCAFLDIHPIQEGQVLVVPKKQVSFIWDLEDDDYVELMKTVKKIGERLRDVFPHKDRVGVMVEGLDVTNHAHVKVFPFSKGEYRLHPDMNTEPNHDTFSALAETLRFT